MDLSESFQVLRRHRILTIALLVLTMIGTAGAAAVMPWSYSSKATVVLLNSKSASAASGNNPYLAFASSLTQAADVICLEVTDPSTGLALAGQGYTSSYTAAVSSATGAPMIQITATGSNRDTVEHTLQGVTQEVGVKLLAIQSNVPPDDRITSKVISSDLQATRSSSKKAKPLAVVLGVGLVLTFAIPHLVDGMAARRRIRRSNPGSSPLREPAGEYADARRVESTVNRPRAADHLPQEGSAHPGNGPQPGDTSQPWAAPRGRNPQYPPDGRDVQRPASR